MSGRFSRRQFMHHAALTGATLPFAYNWLRAAGANERLNVAAVGCAGRGGGDLNATAESPNVDIVALCDIDESARHLGKAAEKFPKAQRFTDWRKLLDHAKDFDAVIVGIPDHMHCPVALAAMHLKKHVYCEKPLAHTLFETRQLHKAADKYGVVTQMGNQIQAHPCYLTAVKLVHDGTIGKVKEVHSWQAGKMRWMPDNEHPMGSDPVPASVNWNDWLGPAPERPYKEKIYHPFAWRAWRDFSNGQLGDFGCHILDPVFMALKLTAPLTVQAEAPPLTSDAWTHWSIVRYVFPGTERTSGKTLNLTWYDGQGRYPRHEALGLPETVKLPQAGSLLLGEKGSLLIPHVGKMPKLLPEDKFADFKIDVLPARNHNISWADACRGHDKTTSPFSYAAPLTEAVLLGTVAIRLPKETLAWDADRLKITNSAAANALVTKAYRKGWEPAWL